jgi:hypothetical protein
MKKLLLLIILIVPQLLKAGTTVVHVDIEGWGIITDSKGDPANTRGAFFWNGTKWVTNETAAHTYFTDLRTGKRLLEYNVTNVSDRTISSPVFDTLSYHIIRQNYQYSYPAKQGGAYQYEAVEYLIGDTTAKKVVIRSRGTGNGIENSYFDIFVEVVPNEVTAIRNDPQWFTYPVGMSMEEALEQTSPTQYLTGTLPTTDGYYFMDQNGGSDMGGLSYNFHTGPLTGNPNTADLSPSYSIDFMVKFMTGIGGNLIELLFQPELISETYIQPLPTVLTDSVGNINCNTATAFGNLISIGGSTVSERGFVYSKTSNPTTSNGIKVTSGLGTGLFSATLNRLAPNTIYHVRAFAINSAGTTYGADRSFKTDAIHIDSEDGGIITDIHGDTINTRGAIFWDGKKWVTNNSWNHMFYTSLRTGQRVKEYNKINISDRTLSSSVFDSLSYHITRQNYQYTHPAKNGGSYKYEGVEYIISDTTDRKVVIRSRGTGNGIENCYFDLFVESVPNVITAIRNDPQWFNYPSGMSMEEALEQNSPTQYLFGTLPTIDGDYFMDHNGGSDMGGVTYNFHTGPLTGNPNTADLSPSYPIDFMLKFMDSNYQLEEFRFLPKLINETYTPPVIPNTLSVFPNLLNIGYLEGSYGTVMVSSNTTWEASSNQTWLKVDPNSGSGNGIITMTSDINSTIIERQAIVTIWATGVSSKTITVTQAAGAATLSVSPTTLNIATTAGSSTTFSVLSNTTWSVLSNTTWLTVNPLSFTGNGSVTISVEENPSTTERTAIVTVSVTGATSRTVTITQSSGVATLSVSPITLDYSALPGDTTIFKVTSNTTWSAFSDQLWLEINPTTGTGSGPVSVTAELNPTISERIAIVTVSANGLASKTVTITQAAGATTFLVSPTSLDIGATGGSTASISVTSNSTWLASSDQIWLTISPITEAGNSVLTLTAGANPTSLERSATITISAMGASSQTVTVKQTGWVGISDKNLVEISVYPNPFTEGFYVNSSGKTTVSVFDIRGRLILNRYISGIEFISAGKMDKGFYFIELTNDRVSIKKKLIKK